MATNMASTETSLSPGAVHISSPSATPSALSPGDVKIFTIIGGYATGFSVINAIFALSLFCYQRRKIANLRNLAISLSSSRSEKREPRTEKREASDRWSWGFRRYLHYHV